MAMPQVRVLGKGARITGGIFCLLFALHTWIWVLRDILELEFATTWRVWTGGLGSAAGELTDIPATTATDVGLGLLQIAAVFAAFTGAWAAGGLIAVTTALTLSYRLPVIWHAGLHSESSPYYALGGFFNDPAVDAAWTSCVWTVIFCVPLAIVLMAGNRTWTGQPPQPAQPYGQPPQPYGQAYGQPVPPQPQQVVISPQPHQPYEPPLPSESPQRPTGAHAVVTAVFLGLLMVFHVGWSLEAFSNGGGDYWLKLFTGEGTVVALLDASLGWEWLTLIIAGGVGVGLALARRVSARGFTLGLAILLLPEAFIALWGQLDAGTFFELGDAAPVAGAFGRLQVLITLAGAVTLIVLTLRPGIPAQPGPAPAPGAAVPFGAQPGQPVPQPYFPPQPGPGP
ncbi:hypothetical protein AN219_36770, partial [Streptomyces nanshensis]